VGGYEARVMKVNEFIVCQITRMDDRSVVAWGGEGEGCKL